MNRLLHGSLNYLEQAYHIEMVMENESLAKCLFTGDIKGQNLFNTNWKLFANRCRLLMRSAGNTHSHQRLRLRLTNRRFSIMIIPNHSQTSKTIARTEHKNLHHAANLARELHYLHFT